MLSFLNLISGPLAGLVEKAILSGVMYLLGRGYIQGDATGIAAAIYTVFSAVYSGVTRTQAAKIDSVSNADNGVKVVPDTTSTASRFPTS